MTRPAPFLVALSLLLTALVPGASAQGEDVQAKIRTSIDTMIQAIEEGNDPMRNRM
ncbi:MAG: hypothetical protein HKN12_00915, partial [Gemmatimonadetes bacterium]|nr:hypothetical protein [Gemmatimonadota bacterium]